MNQKGKPTLDNLVLTFAVSVLEDIIQCIENDKKTENKMTKQRSDDKK